MKQRIETHFDENEVKIKAHLVDLTCRLVRQRTVNVPAAEIHAYPYMQIPGQEERVVKVLAEECARLKIDHKRYERDSGRPTLVASVGKGRKKLVVACHTDVSPPGAGWTQDPFEPRVAGGVIRGRGTVDNKGPLAAAIVAALALKPLEKQLKGQLVVVAFPDHKRVSSDGDCGMDWLLSEGILKPDFAIVPDVGKDLRAIGVAEKGRALVRVKALGKQAHGAVPDRGDNAIMRMVRLLTKMSTMTLPYKPHELMGRPTLNVGQICGGVGITTVPSECEVGIDIRYLPGQSSDTILGEIRKMAAEVGGNFEFSLDSDIKPCQIDPDNILVRSIQENTSHYLGFEAQLAGTGVASAVRKLADRGALSVGFGPGNEASLDSVGEAVEVDQLYQFARIIASVIVDLFT